MLSDQKSNNIHSALSLNEVIANHPRHPSLLHIKKHNVQERRKLFEKNVDAGGKNILSAKNKDRLERLNDIEQNILINRVNLKKDITQPSFRDKLAKDKKHFFDLPEDEVHGFDGAKYQESRSDFSRLKSKNLKNDANSRTIFSTNLSPTDETAETTLNSPPYHNEFNKTKPESKTYREIFSNDSSEEVFSYKSWLDKKQNAEKSNRTKNIKKETNVDDDSGPYNSKYKNDQPIHPDENDNSNDTSKNYIEKHSTHPNGNLSHPYKKQQLNTKYDPQPRNANPNETLTNIKPFSNHSRSRSNSSHASSSASNNTNPDNPKQIKYFKTTSIPDHLPPKPPRLINNLSIDLQKVGLTNTYYNSGKDENNNSSRKKSLNAPSSSASSSVYEFLTNTHSAILTQYNVDENDPICQTSKSSTFPKENSPTSEVPPSNLTYCKSDVVNSLKEKYEKQFSSKSDELNDAKKPQKILIKKSAESPDKKKSKLFKTGKSKVFVTKNLITNPNYIYIDPNEKDKIIPCNKNRTNKPPSPNVPPTAKPTPNLKFKLPNNPPKTTKSDLTQTTTKSKNKRRSNPIKTKNQQQQRQQPEMKPLSSRFASVHEEEWKKILSNQDTAIFYDGICGNVYDDDDDDDDDDLDVDIRSRFMKSEYFNGNQSGFQNIDSVDNRLNNNNNNNNIVHNNFNNTSNNNITNRRRLANNTDNNNGNSLNYNNNNNNNINSHHNTPCDNRNSTTTTIANDNNNKSKSKKYCTEQLYEDPTKLRSQRSTISESVKLDAAGYAIPSVQRSFSAGSVEEEEIEELMDKSIYMRGFSIEERCYVKSKVSDAYAILRLDNNTDHYFNPSIDHNSRSISMDNINQKGASTNQMALIEHKKHLNYVSTVRQKTLKNLTKYEQIKSSININLFEYGLMVQLATPCDDEYDDDEFDDDDEEEEEEEDEECGAKGYSSSQINGRMRTKVIYHWPLELTDSDLLTANFCFPDSSTWHNNINNFTEEMFSFFLTTATGDRKFCWCLRYLPPDTQTPEAICIVSAIGETNLYQQLLRAVKQAREYSPALAQETMQAAHKLKFPKPNKELYIVAEASDGFKYTGIIKRITETHFSTAKFGLLVQLLPVGLLIQLLATILLERKVIFIARRISTLSSCIMSISTLLYPFAWPHTLITVLPPSLADVIDSPSPYILGVLTCFKHLLDDFHLEEVLVVNLDEGYFVKWTGDEGHILPKKIQRALMVALSDVQLGPDNTSQSSCITDVTVTEAFVRMFVEMCGHYSDFIRYDPDKGNLFQREEFVKAVSSNTIRLFLDWFSRTPMFQVFISDRLKENCIYDLFEQRINEYRQEMEYLSNNKAANMKVIRDKLLNFFKNYGSKLKKTLKKNTYV